MANQISSPGLKTKQIGDYVIDGLAGGLLGGALMLLVFVVMGLLYGETPTSILQSFRTMETQTAAAGGFLHIAVSSVYGSIFGLLVWLFPSKLLRLLPGWLAGLAYGALLLFFAVSVLLPGLGSPLGQLPMPILSTGHFIYGMVLGWYTFPKPGKG